MQNYKDKVRVPNMSNDSLRFDSQVFLFQGKNEDESSSAGNHHKLVNKISLDGEMPHGKGALAGKHF